MLVNLCCNVPSCLAQYDISHRFTCSGQTVDVVDHHMYGDVIAKNFCIDRLPDFLTYGDGASLVRLCCVELHYNFFCVYDEPSLDNQKNLRNTGHECPRCNMVAV